MKRLLFTSLLLAFTQVFFAQSKESVAQAWMDTNMPINKTNQSFAMLNSHSGPSGETFRFYHTVNGVEVFDSSVAVHVSNKNQVTYHASTFDSTVETIDTNPSISAADALSIAKAALDIEGYISQKEVKLYVYNKLGSTQLVYRVTTMSEFRMGNWETIVDAKTGTVLSTQDIAIYHKKAGGDNPKGIKNPTTTVATGTAMVFDPDPLTKTGSTYGGNYVDNNDQTNPQLDAARTAVNLLDIEFDGTNYRLRGPYTEIAELGAPSTGLFIQASPDFSFTRDEQGFEAANCYHHIDKSFRYINDDLGIPLVSIYNGGVVRYDPHGANGADNSFYSAGSLQFGEGGVDDAEDMDVVLHELGHGLHDFITNGNLSQVNGLSEGTGDYWANSYKRSTGFWDSSDPQYFWVFGWDGHNPFWNGRVTNYSAMYPGGLTGSIHTDGQIWSSVLLEIWEIIGREKMDAAVWEGLAMTNSGTNQQNAAIAVRQAAIDMGYTCPEIDAFTDRFTARGYVLPNYTCDPNACDISVINTSNISPCNDNGTPSDGSDDFFTADITVTFENPPATGTLDITGDGTASVSVTGLVSPHTFVGVQMSADGGPINLTATFSADGTCNLNVPNAGTAPGPCVTVGINENEALSNVSIYPNPANTTINLSNLNEEYNVAIYNMLGQKVKQQTVDASNSSINISDLTLGVYVLKFKDHNNVLRFVVE
ncbi:T9SS type A sorting domain-containing protein [Aequorivita todarodis]|uniref:T9SS type A sorting domain-containing protein n=1 Tax=Aequorivita todarodis TaxID=2036821 RepID=UPI0023504B86|nr:T9SS type A sorting domain-containing protein [Aequorivita todarodis]MDC8001495.1 T9SS type A sorting domain-containing protein [Aequorivita todarodis]